VNLRSTSDSGKGDGEMELSEKQTGIRTELIQPGIGPGEDPGLARLLRDTLESGVISLVEGLSGGETLWTNKRDLHDALACEAGFAAQKQEPFECTLQTARGTLVHRAIERLLLDKNPRSPFDRAWSGRGER